jgi:hypothetical protein
MVAIGVTGHRNLRNHEELTAVVDQVFERIYGSYGEVISQVVSPLAEGADRLVAKLAMDKCAAELIVPLPFGKEEYELDFESNESKIEFENLIDLAAEVIELLEKESKELSYLAAGMFVLEHCDVLIAIWDGTPPRGIGGTGEIVKIAREHNTPLAWIRVQSSDSTDYIKPTVKFERFPPFTNVGSGE